MPDENKQVDPDNINYTTNTYDSNSEETNEEHEENNLEEKDEPVPIVLNEEFVKPKKSILPKILIGIVVFLLLLLILGITLYFTGFFEHKEAAKIEAKEETPIVEKVETNENTYKFDIKDINSKKLNEQLANLTNKNITNEKTEEVGKKEEDKKLSVEQKQKENELLKSQEEELSKQKAQLEEKKHELEKEKNQLENMKQQATILKNELESSSSNTIVDGVPAKATEKIKNTDANHSEDKSLSVNKDTNNEFLLFISVAKIKGVLYKKYLDKIVAVNPNVKLCRDDENRIEIYYGPFENNEERNKLLTKLLDNKFNEAYELEFTQEEYDKRCNY